MKNVDILATHCKQHYTKAIMMLILSGFSWKEWDSADVNAMGGHYGKCPAGSAFQAALSQGHHAQIVELLMENVQRIVARI